MPFCSRSPLRHPEVVLLVALLALAPMALVESPVWGHGRSNSKAAASPKRPTVVLRHQVRKGETLSGIADRMGVTTSELSKANNVSNPNRIRAGRVLTMTLEWRCPVKGARFVNDFEYVRPDTPGKRHGGIDLMAPRGTPVIAPVPGRVVPSPNSKGGIAFQLHGTDGVRYYGAHLDRLAVQGRVRAGAVIGYVGDTGNARGAPHLHFEAHPGGTGEANPFPTLVAACR